MADINTDELLKQINNMNFDTDLKDDDIDVEFDENDETDPDLLKELGGILGEEGIHENDDGELDIEKLTKEAEDEIPIEDHNAEEPNVEEPNFEEPNVEEPSESEVIEEKETEGGLPIEEKLKCKDVGIIEKYIQLEKVKAVQKKRAGDKGAAMEHLRNMKLLENRLVQVKTQKAERKEKSKDEVKVVESSTKVHAKSESVNSLPPTAYSSILQRLENQIEECNEKIQFEIYKLYKKHFECDKEILLIANAKQETIPQVVYENVVCTYERKYEDIGMNELVVRAIKGKGLYSKELNNAPPDSFLQFEFGYPNDQVYTDKQVFKNTASPTFNVSKVFVIDRTRAFQRYIERKKLTIEVFHYRGFLRKSLSLGKATIPLDGLNSNSEISNEYELVDSNKKKTGGSIFVSIRLSSPLQGKDLVSDKHKWMFLEQTKDKIQIDHVVDVPVAKKPTAQKKKPVKEQESIELDEELHDLKYVVSNLLMEKEVTRIDNVLSMKPPKAVIDALTERKQQIQIQMNLLVIKVQSGNLTMENYIANVKTMMNFEKQRALKYKKVNDIERAKLCLWRMKVMQEEVEEVENAQ